MKTYIQLLFLLFFSSTIFAQKSGLFEIPAYTLQSGKKPAFHKRSMERLLKSNQTRRAAIEGLTWLSLEEKKKRKLKAKEKMTEVLPLALQNTETQAETLKNQTQNFEGENTVRQLATLKALYQELEHLRQLHEDLSGEWHISAASFASNYTTAIEEADKNLVEGRAKAAEMLYQKALELNTASNLSRTNHLEIARMLSRINWYAINYKDTQALYQAAKEKATIFLAIPFVQNKSQYAGAKTDYSTQLLFGAVKDKLKASNYPFFQLMEADQSRNEKANLRFEVAFSKPAPLKEYEEPTTKKKQKAAEGEGNADKVYSGTMTTYSKRAYVKLTVHYKLSDLETGQVLSSNTLEFKEHAWNDYWYSYSGDKRALSKSEKRSLENDNKEEPWPSNNDLVQMMFNSSEVANGLAQVIIDFANKEGR